MYHCSVDGGEVTKSPGGRAPLSIVLDAAPTLEQTPPVVMSCWLYAAPTEASGRETVNICSGGAVCACRNGAAVQMPATARIPQVYLAVMTHHRTFARGVRAWRGWNGTLAP